MTTLDTNKEEVKPKILSLAKFLKCKPDEITESKYDLYGLSCFEYGNQEFSVGTDKEADTACLEYVKNSVWAFNASFILDQCDLPNEWEDAIRAFQKEKCESSNDALLSLVEKWTTLEDFTQAAISADGRGHFLSGYDGEENEEEINGEWFYIYRTN